MEMFSYLIATGITTGALYSLVALGIVVIYKATEVVNFAHGEMFMLGGFFQEVPWSKRLNRQKLYP